MNIFTPGDIYISTDVNSSFSRIEILNQDREGDGRVRGLGFRREGGAPQVVRVHEKTIDGRGKYRLSTQLTADQLARTLDHEELVDIVGDVIATMRRGELLHTVMGKSRAPIWVSLDPVKPYL